MRKTATYDGAALEVAHRPIAATPLSRAQCELVQATLRDCLQRGRDRELPVSTLSELLDASPSLSNASRRSLAALLERPGFRAEAYLQACRAAAETGELPDYPTFAASVCAR